MFLIEIYLFFTHDRIRLLGFFEFVYGKLVSTDIIVNWNQEKRSIKVVTLIYLVY